MTTDSAGLQYVYNAWNQVVTVKNSSGTTLETYEYDGLGRRIAVTNSSTSTTTNLYYSSDSQVLEEYSSGDYTNRYVWSPVYVNALILRDSMVEVGPTLRLFALQDANWNVVALVNSSGAVVERYDYTPFGQVTIMNGSYTVLSGSAYGWAVSVPGRAAGYDHGRLYFPESQIMIRCSDAGLAWIRWASQPGIRMSTGRREMTL